MKNKNITKKNKKWPVFYAMIINHFDLEPHKEFGNDIETIIDSLEYTRMILREALRVNCRSFYSGNERCLVLFSAIKWDLDKKLAERNVKIVEVRNRHAHHSTMMEIMINEPYNLTHPETGMPCDLAAFCRAEARRSDV